MGLIRLLFGFEGRVNRGRFWLAALSFIVFFMLAIGITAMVTSSLDTMLSVALAAYVPIIASAVAVGIKRLHDRNKSPW